MLWKVFILPLLAIGVHGEAFNSSIWGRDTTHGYRSVAYYVNWAIYGRNFTPQELPAESLTHVLYAFANVKPDTGEVYLSDAYADTDKHFDGDTWDEGGTNLFGCLKQLYLLKQQHRNLKVLLSIGGATYSSNLTSAVSSTPGRSTFAASAVSLIENLGLDGIDIDWEYPENDAQASDFVYLLQEVREALDTYEKSLSPQYDFKLTVACPAGPSYYRLLHLADMDGYVDFWNLMAFDYTGSWSSLSGNQANLFSSQSNPASTPYDAETAVSYYISKGIAPHKIVLGMPIYGRSFAATDGLGKTYTADTTGTWQAGVYDYKALPLDGPSVVYDNTTGSSYSYNATTKELISYDIVSTARQKAAWIQQMGLGGAMWWESSADGPGNDSLILNVVEILGAGDGSGLEDSQNQLLYPNSTYENVRAGMPESSSVSTSLPTATSSASESPSSQTSTMLPPSSSTGETSSGSISMSTSTAAITSVTQGTTITGIVSGSSVSSQTSTQRSQSSTESTLVIPGENGVPGCAYVLASDLGAGASCSSDYCNCGGTVAPLLTSSISGKLTTDCNYLTQPTANSCPAPTSSLESACIFASTEAELLPSTSTTTTTLPAPPVTVTSTTIVPKRSVSQSASSTFANCNSIPTILDPVASTSTSPPSSTPSASAPSTSAMTSTSKTSSDPLTVPLSLFSLSTTSTTSSTTSSSTSSSWLSSASSNTLASNSPSATPSSAPSPAFLGTSSTMPLISSPTEPSTSSADCVISGTCNNYKLLACPNEVCFCGQDINNNPTCFQQESCQNALTCSSDADCAANEACGVKDCCGDGAGRCLRLAVGCLNSSPAKRPSRPVRRGESPLQLGME